MNFFKLIRGLLKVFLGLILLLLLEAIQKVLLFLLHKIGLKNTFRFLSIILILFVGYKFFTRETFLESQSRKAVEAYNAGVNELLKQQHKVKEAQGTFYVYTNDPGKLHISLAPDIYHASGQQDILPYSATAREAKEIEDFLKDENAGYLVRLHTAASTFPQFSVPAHAHPQPFMNKFALFVDFEYTEEELITIRKAYDMHVQQQRKSLKQENIEPFSEEWFKQYEADGIILQEEELNSGQVKGLRSLYQPRINRQNPSYKFYFSSYNCNVSKAEFKEAIRKFNQLYLQGDSAYISRCAIRELRLLQ